MPSETTFPRSAAELTAEWLTTALRAHHAGVTVRSFEVAELGAGFGQTGDTVRIRLDSGTGTGPSSVVAKFATCDARRRAASARASLYASEVAFYRDVAPLVTARVPRCYAAEVSADGETFVLLLEDFPAHRPGDETVGCTPAEARLAVEQLAALHVPFWGAPERAGARYQPIPPPEQLDAAWTVMAASFGEHLPAEVHGIREEYLASLPALHEWMTGSPQTAVHGDFRLDNLLFGTRGSSGELVLVDWQAIRSSRPIHDLTYLVSHSMPTEDRRAHEGELLESYVQGLGRRGVEYDPLQARRDYAVATVYLFWTVLWITGVNINTHERALRRKRSLVQRAGAALLDADVQSLLPFRAADR